MEGRVQGGRRVENDGKCPTNDVPASNAAVVAGLATAAAVGLSLTNVISARFLRLFSRAHLQAVMQLCAAPQERYFPSNYSYL